MRSKLIAICVVAAALAPQIVEAQVQNCGRATLADAGAGICCGSGYCVALCLADGGGFCGSGGGGGGDTYWVDAGAGSIDTASIAEAIQWKAIGSGLNGGYLYADQTQTLSAGTPQNGLQGSSYCAIPPNLYGENGVLHFCAGEWNGSTLTPDLGPAPTSYPTPPTVTGASGVYGGGLLGNAAANYSFVWNAASNPFAFALDAGYTYFETFTAPPWMPSSVNALGAVGALPSVEWYTEGGVGGGAFSVEQYLSSSSSVFTDGGNPILATTPSEGFQPNAVTGFCAGIGPDGGVQIAKVCGNTGGITDVVVAGVPLGWGGSNPSATLGINAASVSLHEVLLSNRPGTEAFCTQLCQGTLHLPTYLEALGDSQTQGFSADPTASPYPIYLQSSLGDGYWVNNLGVGGDRTLAIYGIWEENRYRSTGIDVWMTGQNDFVIGADAGYVESITQTFVNESIADGIKTIILTTLPSTTVNVAGYNSNVLAYNAWLENVGGVGLQPQNNLIVIDVYDLFNNPASPGTPVPSLTSDGTHPNAAGYLLLAKVVEQAIGIGYSPLVQYPDGGSGPILPCEVPNYLAYPPDGGIDLVCAAQSGGGSGGYPTGSAGAGDIAIGLADAGLGGNGDLVSDLAGDVQMAGTLHMTTAPSLTMDGFPPNYGDGGWGFNWSTSAGVLELNYLYNNAATNLYIFESSELIFSRPAAFNSTVALAGNATLPLQAVPLQQLVYFDTINTALPYNKPSGAGGMSTWTAPCNGHITDLWVSGTALSPGTGVTSFETAPVNGTTGEVYATITTACTGSSAQHLACGTGSPDGGCFFSTGDLIVGDLETDPCTTMAGGTFTMQVTCP